MPKIKKPRKKGLLDGLYIRGWKGLADYTGYHPRTLKRWHLERARLPFFKTHPHLYSKWIITVDRVHLWLKTIGIPF